MSETPQALLATPNQAEAQIAQEQIATGLELLTPGEPNRSVELNLVTDNPNGLDSRHVDAKYPFVRVDEQGRVTDVATLGEVLNDNGQTLELTSKAPASNGDLSIDLKYSLRRTESEDGQPIFTLIENKRIEGGTDHPTSSVKAVRQMTEPEATAFLANYEDPQRSPEQDILVAADVRGSGVNEEAQRLIMAVKQDLDRPASDFGEAVNQEPEGATQQVAGEQAQRERLRDRVGRRIVRLFGRRLGSQQGGVVESEPVAAGLNEEALNERDAERQRDKDESMAVAGLLPYYEFPDDWESIGGGESDGASLDTASESDNTDENPALDNESSTLAEVVSAPGVDGQLPPPVVGKTGMLTRLKSARRTTQPKTHTGAVMYDGYTAYAQPVTSDPNGFMSTVSARQRAEQVPRARARHDLRGFDERAVTQANEAERIAA